MYCLPMVIKPLIAICGTTGVGKSRLAVELALEIRGKVINADALQVYQGLDVLTNKLQLEEQRGVEHVLMNFKKPGEQYVVGEWVRDARREIDNAYAEGKVPIVVGGTSYWIHHLLFSNSLPAQSSLTVRSPAIPNPELSNALQNLPETLAAVYRNLPTSAPLAKTDPDRAYDLHRLLTYLDPAMAKRWHWKDTRKVLRNLKIIKENGSRASEVLAEAYSTATSNRYRALIFWLYAEPDALNGRLQQRVDHMLSHGLLDEIQSMRSTALQFFDYPDFTVGIFQAIGFKEFYSYVLRGEKDEQGYARAVAETKQNTIKYARRQIKWIRNKLLPAVPSCRLENSKSSTKAYLLDATDMFAWEGQVLSHAKTITTAFLSLSETPEPASLSDTARKLLSIVPRSTDPADVMLCHRKIVCQSCTIEPDRPVMLEEGSEWEAHKRTTTHKRMETKRSEQFSSHKAQAPPFDSQTSLA